MDFLKDRRVIAVGGGALALLIGLGLAWWFMSRTHPSTEPPPASQGGLVVVTGRDDDAKLDPKRPLRCFVGGQFVGELPLVVCAQRNGVATGALDVGLDQAGALSASNTAANLTPLAPQQAPNTQPIVEATPTGTDSGDDTAAPTQPAQAGGATCLSWAGGAWRPMSQAPMPLNLCVSAVFARRCVTDGPPQYGRWGDQQLRLTEGRVEIGSQTAGYRGLVDPWPPCQAGAG